MVTLLGSRAGCKVNLRHRRVSAIHAAIVNDGSQVLAVDLVTKHGTTLNGLNMEHERLNDGDRLTIPPFEFRIDIEQPSHTGHADVHHPVELEPTPHIVALEHEDTGRILQPNRDLCVIGRRNGCDVVLSDSSVSRAHALLLTYFGHPAVFDLLSANHTFVNDHPVEFQILGNSDLVRIGDSRFRVRLVGSTVACRASRTDGRAGKPVTLMPETPKSDLVDIRRTEGSQKWRIADNLEKATRKR